MRPIGHTTDRTVLVFAGGFDHGELVKATEKASRTLPISPNPNPLGHMARPKPDFIGLEACISDNDIPTTHHRCDVVADIRWSSHDYYFLLIMQSIRVFGNWDCALGSASASPLSSHLLDVITKYNLANSYVFFSASYSDTSLWETFLVSENLANLDDLMHFTLREWTRMSIVPTAAEAECAKSQLKAEPSVLYLTLSAPKMVDL